jgi:hypothetical protein
VRVDEGGWFDILDGDGRPVLLHAVGAVRLDASDDTGAEFRTDGPAERTITERDGGVELWVVPDSGPGLLWTLQPDDAGHLTVTLEAHAGDAPVQVAKLVPVRASAADGGGLFLGQDPARHRILENGSHAALDFVVEVRTGDTDPDGAAAAIAPGHYDGHSVSNGNHAVVDLDSGATWVAGVLSMERTLPVVQLTGQRGVLDEEGREGFALFSVEADLLPAPLTVSAGTPLVAEPAWLAPFEDDALLGLETWAQAAADHQGIVPWHRRKAGRRVPNGWNSWSGSGGTGGHGTDIDEAMILAHLDWMADELRDWGMDWFQIDDGYEPTYGHWVWRADRFPSGPRALTDAIRARGLVPGIWMAPFACYDDAPLYAEHPEWFIDKDALGSIVGAGYEMLDLSNPAVQAYLEALGRTVREDWGFDWLKVDFGYYALMARAYDAGNVTREEAWRAGVQALRDGLGDDVFLLMVGVLGPNQGLVDSLRTTLDNAPVWDWEPGVSMDNHLEQQGHKPTVRTAGRRWYLHDRVWVNHPDLILFRSNTRDEAWPRVTFEEARAFATFVGLSGGIVKLGDKLLELDVEEINTIRTLLPTYGVAARPLDVFEREFPEVWHLPVHAPIDGLDESFEVIGLFHWGRNIDHGAQPPAVLEDTAAPRSHAVDLGARGLDGPWLAYEFWTGAFLGEVDGTLSVEVPSHDSRVVALRRPTGAPRFLGWNRQITMGGSVLEAADWDADAGTLTLRTPVVAGTERAPFTWEIAVHVPPGFGFEQVDATGTGSVASDLDGEVLRLRFDPPEAADAILVLQFSGTAE